MKKVGCYDVPYENGKINKPLAVFEDKTINYNMFFDDYHSDKLSNVVNSMNQNIYH